MIVFQTMFGSVDNPYEAFKRALGADAVGWLDRNLTVDDLKPGIAKRFKVIGGPLPFDKVYALRGVRFFAMVLDDPGTRSMRQWSTAVNNEAHPHHALTHAFMPREVLEEDLPFAKTIRDATTRVLSPDGEEPSVEAAVARIKAGPFLIGDPENLRPFVEVLARVLEVKPTDFGPHPFKARGMPFPRKTGVPRIQAANPMDNALLAALEGLRTDGRDLVITRRARPADEATGSAGG
ncbi:hypothetical protein RDV64_12220 [Acuticoccus sp. MNP-M23]|uniref:hypothetical protein n=1 Tax=Acuticoccus sp. MNP-M23 TaxID=3072793 RepID=UPI002815C6D9|nr:hypothetical protein [Acuticoccus sp. MNP-M23]WMS40862.1 hypothetical protein RDV64_12220 [Acuticoccus sp. MNP-M23]